MQAIVVHCVELAKALVAGAGVRGVDLEFVNDALVEWRFSKVMQTEVSAAQVVPRMTTFRMGKP
jgi:hypothetical protein